MNGPTRRRRITIHRVRERITPTSRFYDVKWDVHLDGQPFARCSTLTRVWRARLVDGTCQAGEFHTLAAAKAWAVAQAERAITGLPPISVKDRYGFETWTPDAPEGVSS